MGFERHSASEYQALFSSRISITEEIQNINDRKGNSSILRRFSAIDSNRIDLSSKKDNETEFNLTATLTHLV